MEKRIEYIRLSPHPPLPPSTCLQETVTTEHFVLPCGKWGHGCIIVNYKVGKDFVLNYTRCYTGFYTRLLPLPMVLSMAVSTLVVILNVLEKERPLTHQRLLGHGVSLVAGEGGEGLHAAFSLALIFWVCANSLVLPLSSRPVIHLSKYMGFSSLT